MKLTTVIGSLVLALAPGALLADMRYSNFDVSYVDVEIDSGFGSVDGDGVQLSGSYELNDRLFLHGAWTDQSFDFGIDGTALELGAGMRWEIKPDLDFVGTLSYLDNEVELGSQSADDDGLAVGGGIRTRVNDSFELDASLELVDMDEAGSDTVVSVGGRYYFKDTLALSFGTTFADDVDTLRVGFRAEF